MSFDHTDDLEATLSKLALNMQSNGRALSPSNDHVQLNPASRDVVDGEPNADLPNKQAVSKLSLLPHLREGYGFRPVSGASTPVATLPSASETGSPLPDPNGLGWPGTSLHGFCRTMSFS